MLEVHLKCWETAVEQVNQLGKRRSEVNVFFISIMTLLFGTEFISVSRFPSDGNIPCVVIAMSLFGIIVCIVWSMRCPILPPAMLDSFLVEMKKNSDELESSGGRYGMVISVEGANMRVECIVSTGINTEIFFYLWEDDQRDRSPRRKVSTENVQRFTVQEIIAAVEKSLNGLPRYLQEEYEMCEVIYIDKRANRGFSRHIQVSQRELDGYQNAGRATYFSGVLNRDIDLNELMLSKGQV